MATISVTRDHDLGGLLRRIRVEMDGVEVGGVKQSETLTIEVEPGRHLLQIKLDWLSSPPVTVAIQAGQAIRFSAAAGESSMTVRGAFRDAKKSLELKRLDQLGNDVRE